MTEPDPGCPSPLTWCATPQLCADTRHDPQACGSCEVQCAEGQFCDDGTCVTQCALGELACSGDHGVVQCIFVESDPEHCGACDHTCPEGAECSQGQCLCGGAPCCEDGPCPITCDAGLTACAGPDASLECKDVSSDVDHCGACDHSCPEGAECSQGQCLCDGAPCCDESLLMCRNAAGVAQCVDPLTSRDHCGACDHRCGTGQSCVAGKCQGCVKSHFHVPVAYPVHSLWPQIHTKPLLADFDANGAVDVAVAGSLDDQIEIFPGLGTGELGEPTVIATPPGPYPLAFEDLDATTGSRELIVGTSGSLAVYFDYETLRNPVLTEFEFETDWEDRRCRKIEVADLVGDELPDVLLLTGAFFDQNASWTLGELWLFENRRAVGEGLVPTRIWSGTGLIGDIDVQDLTGDGLLDIALLRGSQIDVLGANGDGTFTREVYMATGRYTPALGIVDVNDDGYLDVLAGRAQGFGTIITGYDLRTFLGDQNGTFELLPSQDLAIGYITEPVAQVVDYDHDARVDVIARYANYVLSLAGQGDGTFTQTARSHVAGSTRMDFGLGDLDQDGWLDLVATYGESSAITVHLGQPDGSFSSYLPDPDSSSAAGNARAHLYSDYPEPIIVGTRESNTAGDGALRVVTYGGEDKFQLRQEIGLDRPRTVLLSDADGDGQPDALVTTESGLYLVRYVGAGRFDDVAEQLVPQRLSYAIGTGDVDGDGRQDTLVKTSITSNPGTIELRVLSYQGGTWHAVLYNPDCLVQSQVVLADVTGDGLDDIVLSNCPRGVDNAATVSVWPGRSDGHLEPAGNFAMAAPQLYLYLLAADLIPGNGMEILAGNYNGSSAFEISGDGTITEVKGWARPYLYDLDAGLAFAADVDLDGLVDLVEPDTDGRLFLWKGDGQGGLEQAEEYLAPGLHRAAAFEDFDGDGLKDLLLSGGSTSLMILKGAVRCD